MATFTNADDLSGARFVATDLSGARFTDAVLNRAVLRGVEVDDLQIDTPWLYGPGTAVLVNGVDVVPLVDAELDRRFPGRAERRATDPAGLRSAWSSVERTWEATLARAEAMPEGTVDVSVDGEWSLAQTLRHLVLATDLWLRQAVLGVDEPHHPLGLAQPDAADNGLDMSVFATATPTYAEVLEARAGRVAMVRDHLATVTPDDLAELRHNPWAPAREQTVLSCLHVILGEEWEHHRYAVRDLDAIEAGRLETA